MALQGVELQTELDSFMNASFVTGSVAEGASGKMAHDALGITVAGATYDPNGAEPTPTAQPTNEAKLDFN